MGGVIIERTVTYRITREEDNPLDTKRWGNIIHATSGRELVIEMSDAVEDSEDNLQVIHVSSRVYEEVTKSDLD